MKKNILITTAWNDKNAFSVLENYGFSLEFSNDNEEFKGEKSEVFAVICNGFFLHNKVSDFKNLKCIQLTSSGLDRISVADVRRNNIELYNARGVYSIPIAEFVISGLLDFLKHKRSFLLNQLNKEWIKDRNLDELYSKQVAIFGCGSVGEEIAKRLKSFGCYVCGFDKNTISNQFFDEIISVDNYKETIANFDILIISMPLTDETIHFCDSSFFASLKKGSIFVNVARGAIVDERELIGALKSTLFGAVIDVFEEEPLKPDSELWNQDNIIITPHNSYASCFNKERLSSLILRNFKKYV